MSRTTEETKKIRELQNHISSLEIKLDEEAKKEVAANKSARSIRFKIKELNTQLSLLIDKKEIRLSEHAVLRYFERVEKRDLLEIEKEIITDELKNTVKLLGGTAEIKRKGYTIIIKDYIIVTIIGE